MFDPVSLDDDHAVPEKAMLPTIKPNYESRSGLNALRTLMLSAASVFFGLVPWADGNVFTAW